MAGPLTSNTLVRSAAALAAVALLAGCSLLPALPSMTSGGNLLGFITPYRMDIVQGNVVTREQASQIKPGMTRAQVRDILGSPMLTDVFHADRWDYVFTIVRPGTEPQRRNIVARFKGDLLEKLDAPELPTEQEFVASISRVRPRISPPLLALSPEQKKALPVPPKPAAEPVVPMGALRAYPPLEPT
jgi:outer membrane protein assembly factor BamE